MKTWFLAVACLMAVATAAFAEDYPTHPVKLLVGYAPGGAPDAIARTLAQRLSEILKQPFVVENKPGASGTIAANQTAKAAADGYTLFINDISQFTIAPLIYKELPYDPIKAFTPIGLAVMVPLVLVSNPKTTAIKTLPDLIRHAKASPGTLNYGSPGIGSPHHIAIEVLSREAGIVLTHIPYKGSSQYLPAVLAGDIQLALSAFTAAAPYGKTGQLNLLGVTSEKRFSAAPDVPAIAEFYKGYDFAQGIGILAPSGLPPEVVAKLSGAMKIALEGPEMNERLLRLGLIPAWLSSRDYAEYLRLNLEKYRLAVEASHIILN